MSFAVHSPAILALDRFPSLRHIRATGESMKKIALVACVLACTGRVTSVSTRGGERRSEFLANETQTTVDMATRATRPRAGPTE